MCINRRGGACSNRRCPLWTLKPTMPVRLRFGKVLRTFTVHVRAHSDVVVDRLSGDVAGNRGCRVRVSPF